MFLHTVVLCYRAKNVYILQLPLARSSISEDGSRDKLNAKRGSVLHCAAIDDFQMLVKRLTSGGQARDQEPAIQWPFHLVRSSFLY